MKYQLNPLMEITAPEVAIVSAVPGAIAGGTLGYLKGRKISKEIKLLRKQIELCDTKFEFLQFYKDNFSHLGWISSKIHDIVYKSSSGSWKENALYVLDQIDKTYNKRALKTAKGAFVGGLGTAGLATLYMAKKYG